MHSRKVWLFVVVLFLVFILLLALALARPAIPAAGSVEVDPQILAEMATSPNGTAGFLVLFREQADLSPAYTIRDWRLRGQFVHRALQETAARSQARVRAWLEARGIAYRTLAIDNSLFLTADLAALSKLATFSEVAALRANYVHPLEQLPAAAGAPPAATIPWNIVRVGADRVWQDFGIKGQGIVVATIDTGADSTHDALFPNYKCGAGPHANCWYDPTGTYPSAPGDGMGHGTMVLGVMVADDDPALPYNAGMAPDAQWIACKGCTDGGSCTDANLLACADWMLAPNGNPNNRPHVIQNSWGLGVGCNTMFMPAVQAWQAAGIFPSFAPSSSDWACGEMWSPADYPNVLAAGATDPDDNLTFSDHGPSCWGQIKPDVVAPGTDICSTTPGNGWDCWSGNSLSSPHAAGLAALLFSADPGLIGDFAATRSVITSTASCHEDLYCGGAPCPGGNNVYGWGRIDAYAAVESVLPCEPVAFADFSWTPPTPTAGQVVTLTAAATGTAPISYTWDLGDGTPASGPTVTHTYSMAGIYPVVLTAANCATATRTVTHTVTVVPPPCEPVALANFSWTPPTPTTGQSVTLTAAATGTAPITYSWKLDVGSWQQGEVVTHTYDTPGSYPVVLTATNCATATATMVHTVTVACPPVLGLHFFWEPLTPTAGQVVTLTATATSTLPITYAWDLGDGGMATGPVVTHPYAAGTYTVAVTAWNRCDLEQHAATLTVAPAVWELYLPIIFKE
jgi:PKD repeat protein